MMANLKDLPFEEIYMMTTSVPKLKWRSHPNLPEQFQLCTHEWEDNSTVPPNKEKCVCCKEITNRNMRANCKVCQETVCPMCSRFVLGRKIQKKAQSIRAYDGKDELIKELLEYTQYLLMKNEKLEEQLQTLQLQEDARSLEEHDLKGKTKVIIEDNDEEEDEERIFNDVMQQFKGIKIREPKTVNKISEEEIEEVDTVVPDPRRGRRVINRLYNIELQ
jgi:hypothetical protein